MREEGNRAVGHVNLIMLIDVMYCPSVRCMMRIKTVIFDLDGTITRPYFDFNAIRREMGLAEDSGPILEQMEHMNAQQRARAVAILDNHEQMAVAASELNPGARETLQGLRDRGIAIGILTRNRRKNAEAVIRKHHLDVDIIVGREQGPVKPGAYGVLHICDFVNCDPSEVLVVGDYLFDILCAKAAGAISVLLVTTAHAHPFADQADFTIESLEKVLHIIDKGCTTVCKGE